MRKLAVLLLIGGLLINLAGCTLNSSPQNISNPRPTDALVEWQNQHKEAEAVLWREADVNGDKLKDTVLIYRENPQKCFLTVIVAHDQGFKTLQPVPAPVENQRIQFRDIDKMVPLEFIVSGSRGANTGYAIFRIEKQKIIDLFGQDMDRCC